MTTERVIDAVDHGTFRGHRRWTVHIDGPTGPAAVEAKDCANRADAVEQALGLYRNRRVFTPAERAAAAGAAAAITRGLS